MHKHKTKSSVSNALEPKLEVKLEDKLNLLIYNLSQAHIEYKAESRPEKKIELYHKCDKMITQIKSLISELQIEIINMENYSLNASRETQEMANKYIELSQMPGLGFDQTKQIITALRSIMNSIPTGVTVTENLENDISFENDTPII